MISSAVVYLWTLPRWFGAPAAIFSVILGGLIADTPPGVLAVLVVAGLMLMAYAHTWNSFHDWMSGLDQGPPDERSHPKPYTSGQNLIASGLVGPWQTMGIALIYLFASGVLTWSLVWITGITPWIWLPWSLVAACAPLYSFGKFHYLCEFWLALGFGPLAAAFGAASAPGPVLLQAFLAGIPMGLAFGYAAEVVDQYIDADANVPKGLRNIGAVCWKKGVGLLPPLCVVIALTGVAHYLLAWVGILTVRSVAAWPILLLLLVLTLKFEERNKLALMFGLGVVFAYPMVIVILEALYG